MINEGEKIERTSFDIIEEKLEMPYPEKAIVTRIVHATADFSFADLVVFKDNPIEIGIKSLLEGKNIITDVNMVKSGISPIARKFGCKVLCYVSDDETRVLSEKEGITRARAACRLNKSKFKDSIIVVGNSPTSLFELAELMKEGFNPALVIAAPVGFVKAKESKEEILKFPVPCIAVTGVKGGTPVAVSIINALIKLAQKNGKKT
mgnify:CR=1 FL=1|jgi:precorrin-8X/cobalt-precorrin-8 methylmutase|tara:strand:+ start:72 stop:689 length:618 start_codon:yes stop_codon:yes gene_type:complete